MHVVNSFVQFWNTPYSIFFVWTNCQCIWFSRLRIERVVYLGWALWWLWKVSLSDAVVWSVNSNNMSEKNVSSGMTGKIEQKQKPIYKTTFSPPNWLSKATELCCVSKRVTQSFEKLLTWHEFVFNSIFFNFLPGFGHNWSAPMWFGR